MTCKDDSLIHHVYTTWNIPFLAFSFFLEMWMWKRTCSTISTTSWLHGRPHASLLHISWISEWAASFANFAKAHASPSIGSQVRPTWSHSPVKCRTCPGADLTVRERVERVQNTISRLHTTHFLITLAFYSYVCSPDGATPHLHPTPGLHHNIHAAHLQIFCSGNVPMAIAHRKCENTVAVILGSYCFKATSGIIL